MKEKFAICERRKRSDSERKKEIIVWGRGGDKMVRRSELERRGKREVLGE